MEVAAAGTTAGDGGGLGKAAGAEKGELGVHDAFEL